MKKYIPSYILLLAALTVTVSACKDSFLEVIPKGKQVASTVDDYDQLMNSAIHYQYLNGGGWQSLTLMGDEIAAEESYYAQSYPQTQRLFRWDALIFDQTEEAQDIKTALYNNYRLNKIINEVMDADGGTNEQKRSIRAEALATRAFNYFQLINIYAKPYNAATAATDAGFPINTTADITKNDFNRGTVQGMYDFIIADLKEAIAALPAAPAIQTRMSRAAANALLGKVYLFMAKSEEALPFLNQAFSDMAAWPVPPRLYDYNVTFAPGGSFLPIGINGPVSPSVTLNDFTEVLLAKTFSNTIASGSNGIVISPATAALYSSNDWRLKFYSATYPSNAINPSGRLRKYGVQYSRFGIGLAELYLLRAECKARTNDLTGAVSDVEALRNKRIPAGEAAVPAALAGDGAALVKFIIEERIREFATEGYRWFDMRRLSVDPLFAGISFTHTVFLTTGGTQTYTLEQPNRLVLRIPYVILSANPGMADNP